jgi:uncharacterized protein YprB with RNaseH-like and TPR domain
MPTLSDKLKSLGVKVGTRDLAAPRPRDPFTIEAVLDGRPYQTQLGETFMVEARYAADYQHGSRGLLHTAPLRALAAWACDLRICDFPPEAFAFLDTETTGLSGGTGTYAFLIGVGRFENHEFHLAQFFMRDPREEPAQLAALEEFLAPCQALVTYNGKAFDAPILATRFTYHGWKIPFIDYAHIDLLHLARRLWRDRLPSRTLGSIEVQILGARRTEQDVPGWMIPQLYFDYLRSGDARPLKSVFYHNAMDVVSLAALFNHTSELMSNPLNGSVEHGIDLIALAKLFEDIGDLEAATRLYLHGLEHDLPKPNLLEAINRLALIHKRQDNLLAAVDLWKQAARHQHIEAHIELAKFYEHRLRDIDQALEWAVSAVNLVNTSSLSGYERRQWIEALDYRISRLQRKLAHQPASDIDDE